MELPGIGWDSHRPDLGLLFVFFVGFYGGELKGILLGLFVGGSMELFSGGPLGAQILTKALMGIFSGMLGRFFLHNTAALTIGLVFLLSLVSGLFIYFLHQMTLGGIRFGGVFRWTVLPEALYNSALGGFLFWAWIGRTRWGTAGR